MNRSQSELKEVYAALGECQADELRLLNDLRHLLDQPTTEQSRSSLFLIIQQLVAHLRHHLELAGKGGYLAEVHRLRPGWHRQIESLHAANLWCITVLDELHERIERELPSAAIEAKVNVEIENWIRTLAAVREDECRLLQRAFSIDLGGEA